MIKREKDITRISKIVWWGPLLKRKRFETVGYIFGENWKGQARNVLYRKALFSGQTLWWISSNVEGRCSLIVLGQKDNWLWLSIVAIDEPQNSRLMDHLNFLFQHFLNIFYFLMRLLEPSCKKITTGKILRAIASS